MECTSQSKRQYIIHTGAKELKIPVLNVYFPDNFKSNEDISTINFVMRSEESLNQTVNYYSVCQMSLDALQLDLAADS